MDHCLYVKTLGQSTNIYKGSQTTVQCTMGYFQPLLKILIKTGCYISFFEYRTMYEIIVLNKENNNIIPKI